MSIYYDIDSTLRDIDYTGYGFTSKTDDGVFTLLCQDRQIGQWSVYSLEALRDPISMITGYVQGYLVGFDDGTNVQVDGEYSLPEE